jgi:hypothetical protein
MGHAPRCLRIPRASCLDVNPLIQVVDGRLLGAHSELQSDVAPCPKSATFGLMHCGKSTLRNHLVGMRGKCYASAPREPAQRRRCRKAVPPLRIEARGHLPQSQQRLPRAWELELSYSRGAPYGVTHAQFAIVSGSALASKSQPCCEAKIPPRSHERLEFDH